MFNEFESRGKRISIKDYADDVLTAETNNTDFGGRVLVIGINGGRPDESVALFMEYEIESHRERVKAFGRALIRWAETGGL